MRNLLSDIVETAKFENTSRTFFAEVECLSYFWWEIPSSYTQNGLSGWEKKSCWLFIAVTGEWINKQAKGAKKMSAINVAQKLMWREVITDKVKNIGKRCA